MADRQPIGDVLQGLTVRPLDEGFIAIDVVALIKTLNEDGTPVWVTVASEGINPVELIGAIEVLRERQRADFNAQWIPDEDDESP